LELALPHGIGRAPPRRDGEPEQRDEQHPEEKDEPGQRRGVHQETAFIRCAMAMATSVNAHANQPTLPYPNTSPCGPCARNALPMIVAAPIASACRDELTERKLPRSRATELAFIIAIAGTKRPETNTKKRVENGITQGNDASGKW